MFTLNVFILNMFSEIKIKIKYIKCVYIKYV